MPLMNLLCRRTTRLLLVICRREVLTAPTPRRSQQVTRGLSTSSTSTAPTDDKKPSGDHGNDDHDGARFNRRSAANFDTIGSWNQRMEMKLDLEKSIRVGKLVPRLSIHNVGVTSLLGRRKENEDRFQFLDLTPDIMMFAVFDGHGGPVAANYTSEYMTRHIKYWLERGERDLQKVLKTAFVEVNNAFTRHLYYNYIGVDQAMNSGTTATVCLLRNNVELVIGWVGDSRALMCRRGKVVRLTQDHKPRVEAEKKRILAAGGTVSETADGSLRVAGKLDMTRSIGDVELKAIGVTAEPQTRSIEVSHGNDAFLILTTDGVNYVMNDQEIINIICTFESVGDAARFITDQALHFGSEDNCTAIVVPFGAWGKFAQSASTVQFSFGRNHLGRRYN